MFNYRNWLWRRAIKSKFGFEPEHLTLQYNLWTIARWNESEVPELAKNDQNLISKLDKIWKEISETKRKTTVKPLSVTVVNGSISPRCLSYEERLNILTNLGMAEMGKRSTAESTTTNTHHGIGTGITSETVSDTVLQTEVGRKVIGTRAVVNQTERYGTAFTDADVTVPKTITEAAIFTLLVAGVMILRITAAGQLLDTGNIITIQTNVTHINGTET